MTRPDRYSLLASALRLIRRNNSSPLICASEVLQQQENLIAQSENDEQFVKRVHNWSRLMLNYGAMSDVT